MAFDMNGMLAWLVQLTIDNIPWLTQGSGPTLQHNVFDDDPGEVYPGQTPYAIWQGPRNSIAHRESGQVGNIKGQPNIYTCSYRESPYKSKSIRAAEQERVKLTYNTIGGLLVNKDPDVQLCPPSEYFDVIAVSEEHAPDGAYIVTPTGPMVGILILVHVEERY